MTWDLSINHKRNYVGKKTENSKNWLPSESSDWYHGRQMLLPFFLKRVKRENEMRAGEATATTMPTHNYYLTENLYNLIVHVLNEGKKWEDNKLESNKKLECNDFSVLVVAQLQVCWSCSLVTVCNQAKYLIHDMSSHQKLIYSKISSENQWPQIKILT